MVGRSVSIPAWLMSARRAAGSRNVPSSRTTLVDSSSLAAGRCPALPPGNGFREIGQTPLPRYSSSERASTSWKFPRRVAVWTSCREANCLGRNVIPAIARRDPSLVGGDRPTRPRPGRKPSVNQPDSADVGGVRKPEPNMPSLEVIAIVVVDQDFRIGTDSQWAQHATPCGAIGRRLAPSQRLEDLRVQPDGADDVTERRNRPLDARQSDAAPGRPTFSEVPRESREAVASLSLTADRRGHGPPSSETKVRRTRETYAFSRIVSLKNQNVITIRLLRLPGRHRISPGGRALRN